MSKLYQRYLLLKKEDSSKIYLFKSGIFYIFLDKDAKKMSSILNLKLTNLNETVLKCGFPVNNLTKYLSFIQNAGYTVIMVDSSSEETYATSDYVLNSDIKDFIRILSNTDSNNLSISEAYSLIDKLTNQAKIFVREMKF